MTPALDAAREQILAAAGGPIDVALVLGSGLGEPVAARFDARAIPFEALFGDGVKRVPGHAGKALAGTWHGKRLLAFAGRFHLYQGYDAETVTAPVALAAACDAPLIILTNAAGGLNPAFAPGDLMLITDQINATGTNPLIGEHFAFVDMVDAYATRLRTLAANVAATRGLAVREGVYVQLTGPTYETPAEARWLREMGGDAVGMSTAIETIVARARGLEVLGISLITNVHGRGEGTSHDEVLEASRHAGEAFGGLVEAIVAAL